MRILITFIAILATLFLSGCDEVRTKLHMMPNQDEQECLNSEKLNFKDPEVLFVANLGSRGLEGKVDQYWVRYKAKNSYGAYIQGNMLCIKRDEKWIRDKVSEALLSLQMEANLLEKNNERLRIDPEYSKEYFKNGARTGEQHEQMKTILFESPDDLDKYISKQSS